MRRAKQESFHLRILRAREPEWFYDREFKLSEQRAILMSDLVYVRAVRIRDKNLLGHSERGACECDRLPVLDTVEFRVGAVRKKRARRTFRSRSEERRV